MSRQRLRIFVSSPGDVMTAREVAAQVIEKIAHEYARFFLIEPYLWEYEPMLASGHFQDSIEAPSQFDAVILILESRLGTPMPERTAVREYRGMDGRTPVTGTEWEYEDALVAARTRGVPDLLVYRSRRKTEIDTWDAGSRRSAFKQMEALDAFWSRHFADHGTFIGAYAKFKSLEEFAGKLENDLRKCIQRRIETVGQTAAQSVRLWPSAPFRGLEAYELEHAPVFFGREETIGSALLRLITNAQAGRPFLLVMGASGSGKSSLVKAGVLPRLLVPQRVSGMAFLRRATFRPGDAHVDEDLFEALTRCLVTGDGETTGLPELLGSSMSVKDLARHLREGATHPDMPFAMVLDQLAERARDQGRILRYEQARLILEVDQLEELFTSERVLPEERRLFMQFLAALVRSGLVWVIATMRADFWHRASETPDLIALADGYGRLDLRLPSSSELSQMIRGPAEAAAIHFAGHPATGIPLNDLIAQEAAGEPGALPLLSYVLDQLYRRDIQEGGGDTLTYASYGILGGLKGAIATRADGVLASQPAGVQQALRQVLFALVQMSAGESGVDRPVARRAPLAEFPRDTDKRRLVEALLDPTARLLVADAAGNHEATVRLAHEALISEWATARNYVAGNAEALKTRRTLEERYARWQAISSASDTAGHLARTPLGAAANFLSNRFRREQGLLTDVDLTDARRLLQSYRDELSPKLIAYLERSITYARRRRRRAFRVAVAMAVVFAILAVGASYEARVASAQREAALQAQWRSLTQTAAARLRVDDVPGAWGVILEVLARQQSRQSYTPEALNVFQEARAADAGLLAISGVADFLSAEFSPDGRHLLTASAKRVRIWDARTGAEVAALKGIRGPLKGATFSADGRLILTWGVGDIVRIWNASTGGQTGGLDGTKGVSMAAFSLDGRRIVTASQDGLARIWDAGSGKELVTLRGHTDRVLSARFSPHGRRVVTGSADDTARIWDARNGAQLAVLKGHTDFVADAEFSPDGRRIVTASFDKTARVWDVATARAMLILTGHTDSLLSASFSPDGRQIATASYDRTARIWNADSGVQIMLLAGHTDTVWTARFAPDGKAVVTASLDGSIRVWDVGPRGRILISGQTRFNAAEFSPHGRRIVTTSYDKYARVWDVSTGQQISILRGHTDTVENAGFSPDGRRIVTGSMDRTARVWDVHTGRQIMLLDGDTGRVANVAFSPDGRAIVTVSADGTARIWDAQTGRTLRVLSGMGNLDSAMYSPHGRRIVFASYDGNAYIWNVAAHHQIAVLRGRAFEDAEFSPDGARIVTASNDMTARIWDVATTRELARLVGHEATIGVATYSPNGALIATASEDGTARLWDSHTGRQLADLSGHLDAVTGVSFSPDGRTLATSSYDGTVRLWDTEVPPLTVQIAWAEAAQFDPLSATERYQVGLPPATDERHWLAHAMGCEPNALAGFGAKEDGVALTATTHAAWKADLLSSFRDYASAARCARLEGWPESAWKNWRYRRASLARVLAREGMMEQVAAVYNAVRKQYASQRTPWERVLAVLAIRSGS